jgi:hypothetical protein
MKVLCLADGKETVMILCLADGKETVMILCLADGKEVVKSKEERSNYRKCLGEVIAAEGGSTSS